MMKIALQPRPIDYAEVLLRVWVFIFAGEMDSHVVVESETRFVIAHNDGGMEFCWIVLATATIHTGRVNNRVWYNN